MRALPLILAAAVLVTGCAGNDKLNTGNTEKKLAAALTRETRDSPASVECPDGVKARKGERFSCKVIARGGASADVRVTLTDDAGHYTFKIDPASLQPAP